MIAVAKPKLSSKENRKRIKAARAAGRASSRAVNKMVHEKLEAESAPRLKGTPSNKEVKRAEGARIAAERKARKKAERLAARPRKIVPQDDKTFTKMIKSNTVTVTMLVEAA
jgi:hypothetical protein